MWRKLLVFLTLLFMWSCGVVGTSQDASGLNLSSGQEITSFRQKIFGRKIRVLLMTYTYDFFPIGDKRTLIVTREDWFPYVNADLQGICSSLGGKPVVFDYVETFDGRQLVERAVRDEDKAWNCVGGKDPFTVNIYEAVSNFRVRLPVEKYVKDIYLVVNHENEQPLLFPENIAKLYAKYKKLEPFSWEKFFDAQTIKNPLLSLHKAATSDSMFIKAQKLPDGSWKALYYLRIDGPPSVLRRFYPFVQFATLCYAKEGQLIEGNPDWVKEWPGLTSYDRFYCKSKKKPFTFKIMAASQKEQIPWREGAIRSVVYVKDGIHPPKK